MENECKCINPYGGSVKCPFQHIAICITGKDSKCQTECVPIPIDYFSPTHSFNNWLLKIFEEKVIIYIINNYDSSIINGLRRTSELMHSSHGGLVTFEVFSDIDINVRFSYAFGNNTESFGRRLA